MVGGTRSVGTRVEVRGTTNRGTFVRRTATGTIRTTGTTMSVFALPVRPLVLSRCIYECTGRGMRVSMSLFPGLINRDGQIDAPRGDGAGRGISRRPRCLSRSGFEIKDWGQSIIIVVLHLPFPPGGATSPMGYPSPFEIDASLSMRLRTVEAP